MHKSPQSPMQGLTQTSCSTDSALNKRGSGMGAHSLLMVGWDPLSPLQEGSSEVKG